MLSPIPQRFDMFLVGNRERHGFIDLKENVIILELSSFCKSAIQSRYD